MDIFTEDYLINLKKFLTELLNEIKHEKKYSYYSSGLQRIISHVNAKQKINELQNIKNRDHIDCA